MGNSSHKLSLRIGNKLGSRREQSHLQRLRDHCESFFYLRKVTHILHTFLQITDMPLSSCVTLASHLTFQGFVSSSIKWE